MPSRNRLRAVALAALGGGAAAAIFAFDLTQPHGAGIGAFYLLPVLLGLWLPWPRAPLALAALATVLTALDHLLSAPGVAPWLALAGRGLALLAIWLIAALLVRRRAAERALRESEERYRRLVEMAPDAIVIQQDGRFTFVNPQAVELLGARDAAEILERPVSAFVHPEDRPAVEARACRLIAAGATAGAEDRWRNAWSGSTAG